MEEHVIPQRQPAQQRDHQRAIIRFRRWHNDSLRNGCAGPATEASGANSKYIPYSSLKAFFAEPGTIRHLLEALYGEEIPYWVDEDTIVNKGFLQVFAILLDISMGPYIAHFIEYPLTLGDSRLPFTSCPDDFPTDSAGIFFNQFFKHQWKFWAPRISSRNKNYFPDECVLPILSKEPIGEGGNAQTFRVELDPEYNDLDSQLSNPKRTDQHYPNTFVLKTYEVDEEQQHENEVGAFLRLRRDVRDGVSGSSLVRFYGSYKHGGTLNILLEHANGGNLEEYFQRHPLPTNPQEVYDFWCALLRLLQALSAIHQVRDAEMATEDGGKLQQGWHQDVKPHNILVFPHNGSSHRCAFKLADLGLSHFKFTKHLTTGDADTQGTRTYGAPECYRFDKFSDIMQIDVSPNVDVWSLGCVLSEAATWVGCGLHGPRGLASYRQNRKRETQTLPEFKDPGCFHDGEKALSAVMVQHAHLQANLSQADILTTEVVDMASEMLHERKHRKNSWHFHRRSNDILAKARAALQGSTVQDQDSSIPFYAVAPQVAPQRSMSANQPPLVRTNYTPPQHSASLVMPNSQSISESPSSYNVPPVDSWMSGSDPPSSTTNPIDPPRDDEPRYYTDSGVKQSVKREELEQSPRNANADSTPPSRPILDPTPPSSSGAPRATDTSTPPSESNMKGVASHETQFNTPTKLRKRTRTGALGIRVPQWSVREAYMWKRTQKSYFQPSKPLDTECMREIGERDHVFIIDDSISMRPHWQKLEILLDLLVFIVKSSDPDGVELLYMIDGTHHREKTTKKLLADFNAHTPTEETSRLSNIDLCLGTIISNYAAELYANQTNHSGTPGHRRSLSTRVAQMFQSKSGGGVKPMNIYVCTDGKWQPGDRIEDQIAYLVKALADTGRPSNQIGIQFIRFGRDPNGKQRLKDLDHLALTLGLPRDIVDRERHDGNVWKMLIGAINKWYDEDSDEDSEEEDNILHEGYP